MIYLLQVSCGPFHSCAVSSAGHLFSWGDGLCGKLGHGNTVTCSEPRQVMALANQAVLHVACGFWHTACVARPQQQTQDPAGTVNYLGGSVDSSASFEESGTGETGWQWPLAPWFVHMTSAVSMCGASGPLCMDMLAIVLQCGYMLHA